MQESARIEVPLLFYEKRPMLWSAVLMLTAVLVLIVIVFNQDKVLAFLLFLGGTFVFRNGVLKYFLPPAHAMIEERGISFYKSNGGLHWHYAWRDIAEFKVLRDNGIKTIGVYCGRPQMQSGFLASFKEAFRRPDARLPVMQGASAVELADVLISLHKHFNPLSDTRTL